MDDHADCRSSGADSDAASWSIPISALQHHLYCPRQCGLIHVEQIWTENVQTAEGRLMHQRVDQPHAGSRRGVRLVTSMPLGHPRLGLHGVADVVEFAGSGPGAAATPVEYKRGKPKRHRADEVQLCAQALCLEHMLGQTIPQGVLFYGTPRRRHTVDLDDALRALTLQVIADVRALLCSGQTPPARYEPARCDRCSLIEDCQPQLLDSKESVRAWLEKQIKD